jgi:hypothetical protein
MSNIKKLVVGDTTKAAIRLLFDQRIAQESNDPSFNTIERALNIGKLKSQVMGFIERNPNSRFELVTPEYKNEKVVKLSFDNFENDGEDEDDLNEHTCKYKIVVDDNFVEASIINKVVVGKDIVLRIKAY